MQGYVLQRHKNSSRCKVVICDICHVNVPFVGRLKHKKQHELERRRVVAHPITPIQLPVFSADPMYEDIYVTFRKHIESYKRDYQLTAEINFQLNTFTNLNIAEAFEEVYRNQAESFKVSVSFSFILLNKETDELAFYWASRNNQKLFDDAHLVTCDSDFRNMYKRILNVDLQRRVIYPSTKFIYIKTTNVVFFVTKLVGTPIGAGIHLPDYLKHNKGLVSLLRSPKTNKLYNDNLCFFRCLALFNGFNIKGLERETKRLFKLYCAQASLNLVDFSGVHLDQLEDLSKIFNVGINIYHQKENRETELVFRSLKQDNILYLNLFGNHFSFISDFAKYSNTYKCPCTKVFHHNGNYRQHLKSCDGSTRKIYYNDIFRLTPTIFEELDVYGINIPPEKRMFPYRITFDCEAYLTRDDTPEDTEKVEYSHKHNLASISVCSNIPDFEEAKCFISNGCPKDLVKDAVEYMLLISDKSSSLLNECYAEYLDQITEHEKLCERFQLYLQQIPVLGFNNSRYDLKLMRDYFIPTLLELDIIHFVIKKGTNYNCIVTENLRFLDICSYLAPGFSYDSFLKAYGTSDSATKSWFPYEWLDSLTKLAETEFPPYEAFYSSLKSRNTLDPLVGDNLSDEEINVIGRRPDRNHPLQTAEHQQIGCFRYQALREMFILNGWSMREYLEFYNNLDVAPFVEALENFSQYYVDRGVDIFKDAISGKYTTNTSPSFSNNNIPLIVHELAW